MTQGTTFKAAINSSGPNVTSGMPTGWTANAIEFTTGSGSKPAIVAYAICGV